MSYFGLSANRYTCLLIPHAPGAAVDLANNKDLGQIILQFIKDKSKINHTVLKFVVLMVLNINNWSSEM
jgi:hypothetical protein